MAKYTDDSETRINDIRKLCINYPRLNKILEVIDECRKDSPQEADPICAVVIGAPGVGKTIMYKLYESQHPRYEGQEGQTIVPVLSTLIPAKASEKGIVTALLDSLGDPMADRGSSVSQTLRLKRLLRACRTELIIMDEFQHIIDRESAKILRLSSDWLKNLINDTHIPIILVGMPGCTKILEDNSQLRRRFEYYFEIEPFAWERSVVGSNRSVSEFRQMLGEVDRLLPFKVSSNLRDYDISYPLFCATGGIIDSVMRIISPAARKAVSRNLDSVPREFLSEACDKFLSVMAPAYTNPFSVSIKTLKPIPLNVLIGNIFEDKDNND